MKIFALSVLAAVVGYFVGVVGGMMLVNTFSSASDKSVEAAMSSIFVYGPIVAVLAFVITLVYLLQRTP